MRSLLVILSIGGVVGGVFAWAHRLPDPLPDDATAGYVVVDKSERTLRLLDAAGVLKTYHVSLGGAPTGPKRREGDERTPEGRYVIDWRNEESRFYRSLHVSYPDTADRKSAQARGDDPGGAILIHGLPNGWGWIGALHRLVDWTDGCVAVTNDEMDELWHAVPNGTPIVLQP